jgi:hypothetical protein
MNINDALDKLWQLTVHSLRGKKYLQLFIRFFNSWDQNNRLAPREASAKIERLSDLNDFDYTKKYEI